MQYNKKNIEQEYINYLWKSVCILSKKIEEKHNMIIFKNNTYLEPSSTPNLKKFKLWKIMEEICFLSIIFSAEKIFLENLILFSQQGPIKIIEDGNVLYIWTQQTMPGDSGIGGRPDIIVTSNSESPNSDNTLRIIEVKGVHKLQSNHIRGEFGKAYDLRVTTYIIWSLYSQSPKISEGARNLGLDFEVLGLDTEDGVNLVQAPEMLIDHIVSTQENARRQYNFVNSLKISHHNANEKIIAPFLLEQIDKLALK